MGCFSTCFPKPKTHKSLRPRKQPPCLNQLLLRGEDLEPEPLKLITHVKEQENIEVAEKEDEPREKLTISGRKKVTFDLNLKFYEGVSDEEDVEGDFIVNSLEANEDNELQNQKLKKENEPQRQSDSSSSSSLFSFPHNSYRYQNCRDSDDEFDQLVSDDESDIDHYTDEEDEDDEEVNNDHLLAKEEESSESLFSLSIDSRNHKLCFETGDKEVNSPVPVKHSDSVLQPVENLAQWKAMKLRSKQGSRNRAKENKILIPESRSDKEEVAVDASLSNWLVGPEPASSSKSKSSSDSVGNSPTMGEGFEDRPILGALTVEEIERSKAALTPKSSPSRSSDDTPIIGSVGSYWNHTDQGSNSGNSRSRFIEGRKGYSGSAVAFEKRLERALEA